MIVSCRKCSSMYLASCNEQWSMTTATSPASTSSWEVIKQTKRLVKKTTHTQLKHTCTCTCNFYDLVPFCTENNNLMYWCLAYKTLMVYHLYYKNKITLLIKHWNKQREKKKEKCRVVLKFFTKSMLHKMTRSAQSGFKRSKNLLQF